MALNRPYIKVQSPTFEKPYRNRIFTMHINNPKCKGHQRNLIINYNINPNEYLDKDEIEVSMHRYWQQRYGFDYVSAFSQNFCEIENLQKLQKFSEVLIFLFTDDIFCEIG